MNMNCNPVANRTDLQPQESVEPQGLGQIEYAQSQIIHMSPKNTISQQTFDHLQQGRTDDIEVKSGTRRYFLYGLLALLGLGVIATAIVLTVIFVQTAKYRESFRTKFDSYLLERNISFPSHQIQLRFDIFIENQLILEELLRSNLTWVPGHNNFSHLSKTQIQSYLGFTLTRQNQTHSKLEDIVSDLQKNFPDLLNPEDILDDSKPLRFKNGGRMLYNLDLSYDAGRVRNDGGCGATSMFVSADLYSSMVYRRTGQVQQFSPQELIDCTLTGASSYNNQGCNGGSVAQNIRYLGNKSLSLEKNYPFIGSNQPCKDVKRKKFKFVELFANNCNFLDFYARYFPMAMAFHATYNFMVFYKSGIFSGDYYQQFKSCSGWWFWRSCSYWSELRNQCNLTPNIMMLTVGNFDDFMKVKTTWGTTWGQNGYFQLKKWYCQMCYDSRYIN